MEKITSDSNEKIRQASALCKSAKARKDNDLFLLEGARLCEDAAENGVVIKRLFLTTNAARKYSSRLSAVIKASQECYEISEKASARISDTQTPQGVFCVCETPRKDAELNFRGKYIALENIQDPSNIGAISRVADALGIDGIIISGGCDIYNPKAQRSAMGTLLRMPIIKTENLPELLDCATNNGMATLASTPESDAVSISCISSTGGIICVIGNEGNGITSQVMLACTQKVTIPMQGTVQSMNAACAAAIIMWEMVK